MNPSHQNIVLLLQDHDRPTPNTKLSDIIALLDTQANHTDVVLPESRSRRSRSLHASLSSSYRKFFVGNDYLSRKVYTLCSGSAIAHWPWHDSLSVVRLTNLILFPL